MKTKVFEVRDCGTFIAALAVDMNAERLSEVPLLYRCGYRLDGRPNILLTRLDGAGKATNDPFEWNCRTWGIAHNYILENWGKLENGDVIDVQFIIKETNVKKVSEVNEPPGTFTLIP